MAQPANRPYYPTSGFTNATDNTRMFRAFAAGNDRDAGYTARVFKYIGLPYGYRPATDPVAKLDSLPTLEAPYYYPYSTQLLDSGE